MPDATTRNINGGKSDDGVDLTFSKLAGMQDFQEFAVDPSSRLAIDIGVNVRF